MGLIDNLKEDFQKDAEKAKEGLKEVETKAATPEGRKWVKYGVYALVAIIVLSFGSCMLRGCGMNSQQHKAYVNDNYVAPQTQQVPAQAPAIVQQGSGYSGSDMMLGAAAGALAGYVVGQSRMPDGSVYRGTPEQQVIVKRYYIQQHPEVAKQPVTTPAVAPPTPPVTSKSAEQKAIKASADAAAEAEKAKMKAEADKKAAEEARKNELKAKLAAQKAAPAPKSSFSSFSKSVSTPAKSSSSSSSRSSSSSSSYRRK